jgi:hypothetical protein
MSRISSGGGGVPGNWQLVKDITDTSGGTRDVQLSGQGQILVAMSVQNDSDTDSTSSSDHNLRINNDSSENYERTSTAGGQVSGFASGDKFPFPGNIYGPDSQSYKKCLINKDVRDNSNVSLSFCHITPRYNSGVIGGTLTGQSEINSLQFITGTFVGTTREIEIYEWATDL